MSSYIDNHYYDYIEIKIVFSYTVGYITKINMFIKVCLKNMLLLLLRLICSNGNRNSQQ